MSCKEKKTVPLTKDVRPVFEFDQSDSLSIQSLADAYLKCVNANDFESAADLLYTVRNDSVFPLTEKERTSFIRTLKSIPQFGFEQQELLLFSDRDNELRLAMKMTEDADVRSKKGIINFVLNPVEVGDTWYLTLRSKYAEGVGEYH